MKVQLSKGTVKSLLLMLDDFWRLDDDDEPDFDYIAIMKNLIVADKNRDENGSLELTSTTVDFLFYILDELASEYNTIKKDISKAAKEAIAEAMKTQTWQSLLQYLDFCLACLDRLHHAPTPVI